MIGMHNVENGLAALVSAAGLGIAPEAAAAARRTRTYTSLGGVRRALRTYWITGRTK
jgi:UDP-N-acetylmuramyl tripeptide synthase